MASSGPCDPGHLGAICRIILALTRSATTVSSAGGGLVSGDCNQVEEFFNRIKQCRRVATRYDRLAANYLAFVQLASIRLWLRLNESASYNKPRFCCHSATIPMFL